MMVRVGARSGRHASTAAALLSITRAHNCIAAGLAAVLGAWLSGGPGSWASGISVLAALAVALVVATGNIVNDLTDIDVDRFQKAGRPLPSGRLAPRLAARSALVLGAAALVIGLSLGPGLGAIVIVALALGVVYSLRLKSTVLIGNATVAALSASTILFGALAANRVSAEAAFATAMVLPFVFAREILKAIADHEGDRAAHVTTVSTLLGRVVSRRIFSLAAIVFTGTALLPWMLGIAGTDYLVAISLLALLPTLAVVVSVNHQPIGSDLSTPLQVTKLAWFGGLAAMVLLR